MSMSFIVQNLAFKNESHIFHRKLLFKKLKNNHTQVLEIQIHCYNFYSKIVNIYTLEEFLKFLFQNLFINIDDSNGQSNHMDVI